MADPHGTWTWSSTRIDFSQDCWFFDGTNYCLPSAGDLVKRKKKSWEKYTYPDFDQINKARRREEALRDEERLNLKLKAKSLLDQPQFSEMDESAKLLLLEEEDLDGLIILLLLM